jgi:hypothetical protein
MPPRVVLEYRRENVWSQPAGWSAEDLVHVENRGSADAFDVRVSVVETGGDLRCEFEQVPAVPARASWPLSVHPHGRSLTAAISRRVVADVLAGRPPVRCWPVEIAYRDEEGRAYTTRCEIRVVRLPLTIEAVLAPSSPTEERNRESTRSPAPLAAERC